MPITSDTILASALATMPEEQGAKPEPPPYYTHSHGPHAGQCSEDLHTYLEEDQTLDDILTD